MRRDTTESADNWRVLYNISGYVHVRFHNDKVHAGYRYRCDSIASQQIMQKEQAFYLQSCLA